LAAQRGRQNFTAGRLNTGVGRGGQRFEANRGYQGNNEFHPGMGGNSNYVQGESSAAGASNFANQQQQWVGNYQGGSGYNSGNQQRWNAERGFQYRARDNVANVQPRSGIDADLLQQTVQAVVAVVTAATKVTEPVQSTASVVNIDVGAGGKQDQKVITPVAAPNVISQPAKAIQPAQAVHGNQDEGAKGKDNEGHGPQKKKKEEKAGCF
jgi:hypothetical protein